MTEIISVIICTETVASLARQNRLPDEMIVVDGSENENIRRHLESVEIPFKWSYLHTTPGLTHQRNIGIEQSNGELLFFFDDDVDLDSNYIGIIEKIFEDDIYSTIGAVGGRILNSHDARRITFIFWLKRIFFNTLRFVFLQSDFGNGMFRYSGMPTHPHLLSNSRYIECLSGCCMAFRREVFTKAQFDERLSGYGYMEDADISKQVLDAGYKIYYEASAVLDHKVSPQDRLKTGQLAEMNVVNYAYLFRKNWRQHLFRKPAFYWALLGLFLLYGHSWLGRRGVLNGIKNVFGVI
jgi:GT2 family glycosyltransferase